MAFRDCIISARAQGALSAEEADDLIRRYQAHRDERAAAGHADPDVAARTALAAMLDEEAARAKWHAELTEAKKGEILENMQEFRGRDGKPHVYEVAMRLLEHFGFSGFDSVAGMGKAIVGLVHGELETMLRAFERNYLTGFRHDRPAVSNLVRDMLGEPSGSTTSAAFARSMGEVFEKLRVMYNELGGNIGKLDHGYIPQYHDPSKIRAAGFDKWRADIMPLLAPERIRDPITGEPIRADRLEEAMRPMYDQIVAEGWATRIPSSTPVGKGSLANQRQDHRFLAFKSADGWMNYDQMYGRGDPLAAMFTHINGMARDIAAMKVLGPNPGSMVEWIKQVVQSEHGKAMAGKETLFQTPGGYIGSDKDAGKWAAQAIDDLWYNVRGRSTINQTVADFFGDVRNVLTGTMLGAASITAAVVDPAIERMARRQLGMAESKLFGSNAKVFLDSATQYFEAMPLVNKVVVPLLDYFTGAPRKEAARAGMVVDSFLHILGDEARFAGTLGGHFWSRWIAERQVNVSGLTALTSARKSVFQLDVMGHVADHTALAFDALPDRLRGKLEGYGIDAAGWDKMRAVPHYTRDAGASGFLRPRDVAAVDFDLGARYADMILGETERAVPASTMRSKAAVMGQRPRGQAIGELLEGGLQFKSFGMSMITNQMEAALQETARSGKAAGASYAAQLLITTGVMGALAIQLKALKDGKDAQDMRGPKFWLAAMATGGGLGIYGDFLFKDYTQLRGSFAEQLAGPTISTASDFAKFLVGNLEKVSEGKSEFAHEGVRMLGRYTPGLSSLWQLKLLYQREVIDKLDEMVDPKAHRRWKLEEQRMMKEKGQGYWWPHGASTPDRAPNLQSAVGQ